MCACGYVLQCPHLHLFFFFPLFEAGSQNVSQPDSDSWQSSFLSPPSTGIVNMCYHTQRHTQLAVQTGYILMQIKKNHSSQPSDV